MVLRASTTDPERQASMAPFSRAARARVIPLHNRSAPLALARPNPLGL